ncbi:hypothetical protein ASZ90_016030 [hydrocarbon metagenome]|uniref:Uncharacterized protein n=1 Tax=hydrocarbon metagenome TaxID=938273 RepID=A0A0W8F0I1_9ZZZZ
MIVSDPGGQRAPGRTRGLLTEDPGPGSGYPKVPVYPEGPALSLVLGDYAGGDKNDDAIRGPDRSSSPQVFDMPCPF